MRWVIAVALFLSLAPAAAAADCPSSFQGGFASLNVALGGAMGQPTECEHPDPAGTGDVLQHTTGGGGFGLAYWRKSTNTPIYFDGANHYALATNGLVSWAGGAVDPPMDASAGTVAIAPPVPSAPSPAPVPVAASTDRTLVLFLNGLSQNPVAGSAHWNMLIGQLEAPPFGFAERDLTLFSYADSPSAAGAPCQDAVMSMHQLDNFLRSQRDAGYGRVVLVGHSFGGVLAVLTAMSDAELTAGARPFVRSIATIDSPLLGVNYTRASLWVTQYGTCRAMDQLYFIQQRGLTWETELTTAVRQWVSRVRFLAVANRSDCLFNPGACGLIWMTDGTRDKQVPDGGPGLNLVVDAVAGLTTGLTSHDAALYSPQVVLAIANVIGYQGH
jgi:pimeloyl-ACP methyl ester carboxylesterase